MSTISFSHKKDWVKKCCRNTEMLSRFLNHLCEYDNKKYDSNYFAQQAVVYPSVELLCT